MNQGKYIFAQLTDFLPQRVFDRLVSKYDGNKHVKHFSCWNQLLSMIFGQLTGRDSLRDLMVSIEPHKPKCRFQLKSAQVFQFKSAQFYQSK